MLFEWKELFVLYMVVMFEGKFVSMEEVMVYWKKIKNCYECFIVEGVGGIFVLFGENYLVSDLIKVLELLVVIVVRFDFGIINYIYLIVEYVKNMGIDIIGIIINGVKSWLGLDEKINLNIIEVLCGVLILGIILKLEYVLVENI